MQCRNMADKWRTPAVQRITKSHEGAKYPTCSSDVEVLTFIIQSFPLRVSFLYQEDYINFSKKCNVSNKPLKMRYQIAQNHTTLKLNSSHGPILILFNLNYKMC